MTKAVLHQVTLLALGALAALDCTLGVAPVIPEGQENGVHISKLKWAAALEGKTTDKGPVL